MKNLQMNWLRKRQTQPKKTLNAIFDEFTQDEQKTYILKAEGSSIRLKEHKNIKEPKLTYKDIQQQKIGMNLFGNLASRLNSQISNTSRKNRSPLRMRQNMNYSNRPPSVKQGKLNSQQARMQPNMQQRYEMAQRKGQKVQRNTQFMEKHQTVSDITPICVQLSFKNIELALSAQTKLQRNFNPKESILIPQLIEVQPKQNKEQIQKYNKQQESNEKFQFNKQMEIHKDNQDARRQQKSKENNIEQMAINLGLICNLHPQMLNQLTDNDLQQLKNPYAQISQDSLQKPQKKSTQSEKSIQVVEVTPIGQQICIDDLDIDSLIPLQQQEDDDIKLIEYYHSDFNMKDSIRPKPAMSQVYEVPKVPIIN